MNRFFSRCLGLSSTALLLFACGGSSEPEHSGDAGQLAPPSDSGTDSGGVHGNVDAGVGGDADAGVGGDVDAGADGDLGEAAACIVLASSFDQSCTTDSDCAAVPPGGNVCDACGPLNGSAAFACDSATVSVSALAAYDAAIQPGVTAVLSTKGTSCGSSCPHLGNASCVNGTCTFVPSGP